VFTLLYVLVTVLEIGIPVVQEEQNDTCILYIVLPIAYAFGILQRIFKHFN